MTLAAILLLLAVISFTLAALNVSTPSISFRDAGFAFAAASILASTV